MSWPPTRTDGQVREARHLEYGDRVPWGFVRSTITYRGHGDILFTDIRTHSGQTFTVCADTLYQDGKEVIDL